MRLPCPCTLCLHGFVTSPAVVVGTVGDDPAPMAWCAHCLAQGPVDQWIEVTVLDGTPPEGSPLHVATLYAERNRLRANLAAIHSVLDGTEWDSDTASEIAGILTDAGFTIREPDEMPEDEDPEIRDALNNHGEDPGE